MIARTTTPPDVRSRWIHKGCKRVCVVIGNRIDDIRGVRIQLVEYLYERTAGTGDLRTDQKGKRAAQTMELGQWASLFTTRAA